jgi:hypothetical protein
MPGRDSDRKAKTEALTVLGVRRKSTKLPAKTYPGPWRQMVRGHEGYGPRR